MPFAPHDLVVLATNVDNSMCSADVGQNIRARDVTAFLEESMTESKADEFTHSVVFAVGSSRERQSRKCGAREVLGNEVREEVRGHLGSQVVHVSCSGRWIERFAVDQFEGPGPDMHDHIVSAQLIAPLEN